MAQDASAPIDPDDVIKRSFTTSRRGLDPLEVQRYLLDLANQMRAGRERERTLEGQLRDAEKRATPIDQLDPSRLTALLGEETARVLDAARAAAAEIRAKAEENVARLLREARDEAQRMRNDAESILLERTEEAEAAVARIRASADGVREQAELDAEGIRADAAALRDKAESDAADLREQADADAAERREVGRQEGREMVAEAQRVRQRMLDDLARRRKLLRQQIEQLQAGRDRLLGAYEVVRENLDLVTEELEVALPEAKLAAEAASLRATEDDEHIFIAEVEAASLATDDEAEAGDLAAETDDGGDAETAETAGDEVEESVDESPEPEPEPESEPEPEPEPEPETEPETEPESEPEPEAESEGPDDDGVRAPDPDEGRHSTSVKVVRTDSADRTAAIFAQMRDDEGTAPTSGVLAEGGEGASEGEPDGSDTEVADDLDDDHRLIRRRDEAIADLERNLARRLKRDLSDEQNELLDAMRKIKGSPQAETVLPDPEAHVERYRALALPVLADAAEAGAELLGESGASTTTAVEDLADDLAAELVLPLRERLERCFAEAEGDEDELAERLRACYREWKAQRVEPPVAFAVVGAANRGMLDGLADGVVVHWVVEDGGMPSPDCEDNALAEGVVKGEPFPTGHLSPPAHLTCRCLVVAASS